jgi:hypothetical protein
LVVALATSLFVVLEGTASPCSVTIVVDSSARTPHERLLDGAELVVRARAETVVDRPGRQGLFPVETQVRFRVLAVYKGTADSEYLEFNGVLGPEDPSEAVPFDFVNARNRGPSCFTIGYRRSAEYLLMLRRGDALYTHPDDLSPYWAALSPTNERITGDDDPWLRWVVETLAAGAK